MNVRFGIIADLHAEFIPDAPHRMEVFLQECRQKACDFIVELGDFCPPGPVNQTKKNQLYALLKNVPIPFYHIIGNHDTDSHSKEELLKHWNMPAPYYSFDFGGVHFAVLDACWFSKDGQQLSYDNGNYKSAGAKTVLPDKELSWLKQDLACAKYPTVIFSHPSLVESRASITNAAKVRKVFSQAPLGVMLCVCGHEHVDRITQKDGVYYYCLNSASYYWAGSAFKHSTYGQEIEQTYPQIKNVFPYSDPLFAIIEINTDAVKIFGRSGHIVGPTPAELHFQKEGLCDPVTPSVSDRVLSLSHLRKTVADSVSL